MRVVNINDQGYGIDPLNMNKDNSTVKAESLSEIFKSEDSAVAMNKTEFSKSSLLSGLCDGNIDSLKEQAKALRDNLTAVFNKMETGEGQSFDEDGISVNDTEVHKIVTVVDQIRIKLAMYCDDFEGSVDVDLAGIEDVVGSAALAYKVSAKLKNNNFPATEENVSEVMQAVNMASSIKPMDSNAKAYIVKNKLEPTIDNVYKAEYAGAYAAVPASTISDEQWSELEPQVSNIIKDCGYEVNDSTLADAKWMLENNIDLTEENFTALQELSNIKEPDDLNQVLDRIMATMTEGNAAADTLLTDKKLPWEETVRAIVTLNGATKSDIMEWTNSGKELNLENLYEICESDSVTEVNENDINYIRNYRQIQEARLMMTIDAGRTMEKNGISINTLEISDLVEQLKQLEQNIVSDVDNNSSAPITRMQVEQSNQVIMALENLKSVPSAVIGSVVQADETRTINTFLFHAPSVLNKMVQAGEAYETMSTEVRPDLGDSIIKAVTASTSDLLGGMGYENNDANARAVRILAYNNMDINEQNIDAVKNIDYAVNKLFKEMTPAAALDMIRNNINPLETDVTTLSDYLSELNSGNKTEVEKYSEFLYRLDKQNDITDEEREKFIGVYKLVTKFDKDGGRAIGQLLNQGLDLTMGNLLTAYMSRNDSGIDVTLDESFGTAEVSDKVSYFKSLFADMEKKVRPDNIADVINNLDSVTPEQMSEMIEDAVAVSDDPVYEKYSQMLKEIKDVEDSVIRMITDNEIPATYSNIVAAQELASDSGSFFRKYFDKQDSKKTEDEIIESIDSKESINDEYDKILENTKELINEAVESESSYLDIESLRLMGNSISVINSLAKRNNYYIPYEQNGTIGTINLKVIENSNNSGLFTIDMKGRDDGDIHVEAKVNDNVLNAQILCSKDEEVTGLETKIEAIKTELLGKGFDEVNISINKADEFPYDISKNNNEMSVKTLFSASKIFISELIK